MSENEQQAPQVPPALKNIPLEKSVLSACINGNGEMGSVLQAGVDPDCFTSIGHRMLFRRLREMHTRGETLAVSSVQRNLDDRTLAAVGNDTGLFDIATAQPTNLFLEGNVEKLLRWKDKRETWQALQQVNDALQAGAEVAEAMRPVLKKMQPDAGMTGTGHQDNAAAVCEAWALVEKKTKAETVHGITTGISELDALTGGMQPGRRYILAARPGEGKTALAVNMAVAAAKKLRGQGRGRVLFVTAEMSAVELADREISLIGMVSLRALEAAGKRAGKDMMCRAVNARKTAQELPITFLDVAGWSVEAVAEAVRMEHRRQPVALVVVDYLQLFKSAELPHNANSFQHTEAVSRAFSLLARQLDAPLLILGQLNRECAKGTPRPPQLADLKNSGQIEQDADMVMLLYQPEAPKGAGDDELKEYTRYRTIRIAKNRFGPNGGTITLRFHGDCMAFRPIGE